MGGEQKNRIHSSGESDEPQSRRSRQKNSLIQTSCLYVIPPTGGKKSAESVAVLFFAVGVGEANLDVLGQLSVRQPLMLRGLQFRQMFQWLSTSLKSVSHSGVSDELALKNPTAPDGWAKL